MTSDSANGTSTVETDLLVVGSGAGGLSAAVTARHLGLDVIVAEKEKYYGGTTARSGGWMWIPGNPLAKKAGIEDSAEMARTYLRHEAGNYYDEARVSAFLENGPRMVEFFERETALQFILGAEFSDYHPDAPGGLPVAGRSVPSHSMPGAWARTSRICARHCVKSRCSA